MGRSAFVLALQAALLSRAEGVQRKGGSQSELLVNVSQFPNAGFPNAGFPNAVIPYAGMPNAGMPSAGIPNAVIPNAGIPNAGSPSAAGFPNAGFRNAGFPNAGLPNAGLPNAGLPNAAAFPAPLPGPQLPAVASVAKMSTRLESCSALKNMGTHSTIEIEVGTPGQKMDVVADTGSDSVIVASCVCNDAHHCNKQDKCFRGGSVDGKTQGSSSFSLYGKKQGDAEIHPQDQMPVIMMAFGSGTIQAVIATDKVKVGSVTTEVKDSLLLMINQQLQIEGPFEGILGLGLPKKGDAAAAEEPPAQKGSLLPDWMKTMMPKIIPQLGPVQHPPMPQINPLGFLQSAKVPRFSICFNDKTDGVLRLNSQKQTKQLGSIGTVHWGLDFRGISIGDNKGEDENQAIFCTEHDQHKGKNSPCGAIPDSGTTIMMAPIEHIQVLFAKICDTWKRCTDKIAENTQLNTQDHGDPQGAQLAWLRRQKQRNRQMTRSRSVGFGPKYPVEKHAVFASLLHDCASWAKTSEDLKELPNLNFHMRGKDGTPQMLTLPGAQYIAEAEGQEIAHMQKLLMGFIPVEIIAPVGEKKKMCSPAFGVHEYNTETNGPVWILGTPFFYQYQVGYDMEATPPSISFISAPCGQCQQNNNQVMLLSQGGRVVNTTVAEGLRGVRRASTLKIRGPLRIPKLDTSLPL